MGKGPAAAKSPLKKRRNIIQPTMKGPSTSQEVKSKTKRTRTNFTTRQKRFLEMTYKKEKFVARKQRFDYAKRLNISEKCIKVWFQNRRIKEKHENQMLNKPMRNISISVLHSDSNESNDRPMFSIEVGEVNVSNEIKTQTRTCFETEQTQMLESLFQKQTFIENENCTILANKFNVTEKSIKLWFQNRRMREMYKIRDLNETAEVRQQFDLAALLFPTVTGSNDSPMSSTTEEKQNVLNNISCETKFTNYHFEQFQSFLEYRDRTRQDILSEYPPSVDNYNLEKKLAMEFYRQFDMYKVRKQATQADSDLTDLINTAACTEHTIDSLPVVASSELYVQQSHHIEEQYIGQTKPVFTNERMSVRSKSPSDDFFTAPVQQYSYSNVKKENDSVYTKETALDIPKLPMNFAGTIFSSQSPNESFQGKNHHTVRQNISTVNQMLRNVEVPVTTKSLIATKSSAEFCTELIPNHSKCITKEKIIPVAGNEIESVEKESLMGKANSKSSKTGSRYVSKQQSIITRLHKTGQVNHVFNNDNPSLASKSASDVEKYKASGEYSIELYKQSFVKQNHDSVGKNETFSTIPKFPTNTTSNISSSLSQSDFFERNDNYIVSPKIDPVNKEIRNEGVPVTAKPLIRTKSLTDFSTSFPQHSSDYVVIQKNDPVVGNKTSSIIKELSMDNVSSESSKTVSSSNLQQQNIITRLHQTGHVNHMKERAKKLNSIDFSRSPISAPSRSEILPRDVSCIPSEPVLENDPYSTQNLQVECVPLDLRKQSNQCTMPLQDHSLNPGGSQFSMNRPCHSLPLHFDHIQLSVAKHGQPLLSNKSLVLNCNRPSVIVGGQFSLPDRNCTLVSNKIQTQTILDHIKSYKSQIQKPDFDLPFVSEGRPLSTVPIQPCGHIGGVPRSDTVQLDKYSGDRHSKRELLHRIQPHDNNCCRRFQPALVTTKEILTGDRNIRNEFNHVCTKNLSGGRLWIHRPTDAPQTPPYNEIESMKLSEVKVEIPPPTEIRGRKSYSQGTDQAKPQSRSMPKL